MSDAPRDNNRIPTLLGTSSADGVTPVTLYADPTTHRLYVDLPAGGGTVTSVSVVTANGVSGSVATATTTPAITLTLGAITPTTVNGNTFTTGSSTYTGTAAQTYTFPTTTATIARTDAGQTFTGVQVMTSPALTTPAITGLATGTGVSSSTTASTLASRDANGNSAFININFGTASTVTAAGTSTLTVASSYRRFYTGSTTQTVVMPVASTLVVGQKWLITNTSSGLVTIQSSGANTILILAANTTVEMICTTASGTDASSWTYVYQGANLASGKVATISNTITLAGTDATTMTFPSTSATIARTDAAQTFTGTQTLAENASIGLDPAGSADGKYTGITVTGIAGYTQAFGDLNYLAVADSRWEATDADAATTADRMLAMVVVAGTDGNACTLLLQGIIRADAKFPALTVGAAVYVGETAGEIQVAIPTGADNIIRRVGYAMTADEIYFNPSMDSQVTVA